MWQKEKKYNSIVSLVTLLALASTPVAANFLVSKIAVSQTVKEFPLLKSIPSGTTVKIDGSSSMARINDSLKQSFEQQYSGTKVEVATNGTDAAISALSDGKIDLAAMGRGLKSQEEAKGLEQYRLRREKIAIVVGENNLFKGNLTDRQFAKIFRGEITDWSQIGGTKGKIRFIDRPTLSDTREAFRNYPVFKAANFATGSTATQLSSDSTNELVKQLGKDGIGYAMANQVSQAPGLRVLRMHGTLPNDSRYPFSQPLVYAYKKNPSVGVTGFLGFSAAPVGTKAVKAAITAEALAVAQTISSGVSTSSPTPAVTTESVTTSSSPDATQANTGTTNTATLGTDVATNTGASGAANSTTVNTSSSTRRAGFPWWLLLPLAALGAAALWLLGGKRRKDEEILEASPSGAPRLPIANTDEVNLNPSSNASSSVAVENSTSSHTKFDNTVTGAALAGGAIVGAGLGSRLTHDSETISNKNIPPQTDLDSIHVEVPTVEEPAVVVMPSYSELHNVPHVDVDATNQVEEPIIDVHSADTTQLNAAVEVPEVANHPSLEAASTQLPDVQQDTSQPQGDSNWLDKATLASGAAATGVAVAGAGLWSRFSNRTNENESNDETQLNAAVEVPEVANHPSLEAASTQLPDVQQDTSNWLDKATLASDNKEEPSRVIISSRESDIPEELTTTSVNVPEISDIPEELSTTSVNVPEVPDVPQVELTSDTGVPEVTNISSVDVPQVAEAPKVEVQSELEPLEDVWEDTPTNEADLNWLNNITLAGGATAVGAGLWSQLANHNQDGEVIDETTSNHDLLDETSKATPTQEEAASETTINFNVPTAELVEASEPIANLEAPAIEDVVPSETKLDSLGTEEALPSGDIGSRDWWTPANTESTEIEVPTAEIASPDVSGTPEQWLNVQQPDSEAATELDAKLPDVSETAFDIVADAAEGEAVTENYDDADIQMHPLTPEPAPETGINAATIAGGAAIAVTGAALWSVSNHSEPTDADVVKATNLETPVAETTIDSLSSIVNSTTSTINLDPRTPRWAYATWNIADTDKENKRQQGGTNLVLRLYDVTNIDLSYQTPQLVQQYECEETIKNRFVAIPISDRDYITEIGYLSADDRWLPIARSHFVRVFSRPHQEFWFEADAELIVHGATEPGSTVTIGGHAVKLKSDGTFHLRIPFTEELIDYVMTAVANDGEKAKTIHMHFSQENRQ